MKRLLLLVPIVIAAACSAGSPPAAVHVTQPPAPPGADASLPEASAPDTSDAANEGDVAAESASDGAAASVDAGPPACPPDMIMVDGEYCTEVEQKCLKSWFDKSNKKTVCEVFEAPTRCIGDKVHKRFCIDRYSWPNVAGERPEVMNNFYQAQVKCASIGRRMCTESEWTMACEGPEMKPYPYGYVRDPHKCNGDHPWDGPDMKKVAKRDAKELARLWKGVRNGAQPECVSEYGVPDLPGNTDDVVSNENMGDDWKGKYDSVHSGGPWYKGVRNQCRPKIYTHDEGFYYYFLSFRCCAESDFKPTDPRTPKQVKANWSFNRVERLARFTVDQMKGKLELKKRGECKCRAQDNLCKTMCGTLLGPNASDADLKAPRGEGDTAP
ncbi:MAG: SUMF1/EgtB/PvdO family nonheme iron enzyme [Deltaproteobacteria bacterium]|nr:SUMF1/EgtB/PvdO family nonheme iron enzyme [Deltaproteobacteria bacterium]